MIYETFFDKLQLTTERVILAEDVDLGTEPKAVLGKFYFPMLTPTIDMNNPYDQTDEIFKSDNIHGVTINKRPFIKSNYIELEIPVHIQFQYFYKQQQECINKVNSINQKIKDNKNEIVNIIADYQNSLGSSIDVSSFSSFLTKLQITLLNYVVSEEDEEESTVIIPAGTEFIITGIGTSIEYDDLRIIGVWTEETTPTTSFEEDDEEDEDDDEVIEFNPYNYGDDQPDPDDIYNNTVFQIEEEDDDEDDDEEIEVINLPVYNQGDEYIDPYEGE